MNASSESRIPALVVRRARGATTRRLPHRLPVCFVLRTAPSQAPYLIWRNQKNGRILCVGLRICTTQDSWRYPFVQTHGLCHMDLGAFQGGESCTFAGSRKPTLEVPGWQLHQTQSRRSVSVIWSGCRDLSRPLLPLAVF